MKKIIFFAIAAFAVVLAGAWYFTNNPTPSPEPEENPFATALFSCDGGKTINASFFKGEEIAVEPGDPPIPTGWVGIILSDGREFTLNQTISASGARYATEDEAFVFWNKGNEATIYEGGAVSADWGNCSTEREEVPCTLEAKACPDGSFVGRQGPDCEFAPCPGE
jgi:hypothetical protein